MDSNSVEMRNIKFPYSGQLEIEIYFKEYKDSCANDCRRFLHKGRNENTPLIEKFRKKLNEKEASVIIFPKDYALLRHVPIGIDVERDSGSKRSGAGKTRGGLEIYTVTGLEMSAFNKLKEVLEEEKIHAKESKLPWFNYYRIYTRDEIL